jgi:Leucine-rich repeat (LRR) protein
LVEAPYSLGALKDDNVTFNKPNGQTITVPVDRLSSVDRFYLTYVVIAKELGQSINEGPFGAKVHLEGDRIDDADLARVVKLMRRVDLIPALNLHVTNVSDDGLLYLNSLDELKHLRITSDKITDAGLQHLQGVTNLERIDLDLMRTQISDVGLERLRGLTSIRSLSLSKANITDTGLAHLKTLTELERLDLFGTKVSDAGLEHLKGLTNLTSLYLHQTRVTVDGLQKLQQALPLAKIEASVEGLATIPVAGRVVRADGTPIQSGEISFVSSGFGPSFGGEIKNGRFQLGSYGYDGAPPGFYKVTVTQSYSADPSGVSVRYESAETTPLWVQVSRDSRELIIELDPPPESAEATGQKQPDSREIPTSTDPQTAAVAVIEKLGGDVTLDDKSSSKPVIAVSLDGEPVTDNELIHLENLTNLQSLVLSRTRVTEAGLVHVEGLTNLQVLSLQGTRLSDGGSPGPGLAHLKGLANLRWLDLSGVQLDDAGLEPLNGLTNLQTLDLSGTSVTDAGLMNLSELRRLRWLNLSYNTQLTDAGLEPLKGLTNLRVLDLSGTHVNDAAVKDLQAALPKCTIYSPPKRPDFEAIAAVKTVGGEFFNNSRPGKPVVTVSLEASRVTDAGLAHLKAFTELHKLNLANTEVSDAGLEHLQVLTNLQELNLSGTMVTDAGAKDLQTALPACRIVR